MNRRALGLSSCALLVLLLGALSACGGDDVPLPPDVDAGDADAGDAGPIDAGPIDAGPIDAALPDAADVDAAVCPDVDGDGHGAASCGDDCDDADANVNPDATEVCNGGIDDDCNGLVDLADGVCVPCPSGYTGIDGSCTDIDECAAPRSDDCDSDPAAICANALGSFTCACPIGFTGGAHGVVGCLLSDASLSSLVPSVGTLSPAFVGATTTYTLALPPGTTNVTLTPSVAYPARATITVDGVSVASDAASAPVLIGFAPLPILVIVTTESGATRTYAVVVGRSSAYLKASNTEAYDYFGWSVSLSADGMRLAVGAPYEDSSATGIGGNQADSTATDSGAVYVFSRTGTTWTQEAYVKASNTGAGDYFGYSVSLSSDGTRLAVGAFDESSSATGIGGSQADNSMSQSGAVYVFSRTGTTWTQEAYVKASNTGTSDIFGYSVSLSADGTRLAVGAAGEASSATGIGGNQADNSAWQSGALYVFSRTGTTWTQEAYVKASNTGVNDLFGYSVSLSSDGMRLAVDAAGEDSSATGVGGNQADNRAAESGAVYVY